MRCPKMDELPVYTEWQSKIYCPNCKHYSTGECNNPQRKTETDPCPMKNIEPVELQNYKFTNSRIVTIKHLDKKGLILNRKATKLGNLYEIQINDENCWLLEDLLE